MLRVPHFYHWLKSCGRPTSARLSRWRFLAHEISRRSEALQSLSDEELTVCGQELRRRARRGATLEGLLPDAYALVCESSRRVLQLSHYPVQFIGGIAMFEGHVAEMQTGEGKTLTALLPTFLRALPGRGCHVVTVNDYLARRDADWMRPVYGLLGLKVGCIQADMTTDDRRRAYCDDVTYATAKELGFDFLRDRLRRNASPADAPRRAYRPTQSGEQPVIERGQYFALIDEADSVLIDDARTPLIIGLTEPNASSTVSLLRWSARAAAKLKSPDDFCYLPDRRTAVLTAAGRRNVLLTPKPRLLDSVGVDGFFTHVKSALTASHGFQRDRDYMVRDNEIVIVDESTGRVMEGRKWQDGLHQAVEAKESLPLTSQTAIAARVTVQRFFGQYVHLAGMTGTATDSARELKSSYRLCVTPIPTHLPCRRVGMRPRIFVTLKHKRAAIVDAVEQFQGEGRAVLVGTPSVEASEALQSLLESRGIRHRLLNARFHESEAEIVAEAGQPGRVTIASNMAGRGTDIRLHPDVRDKGGLHVIGSEMHSSVRIDRQLVGRAARQGDAGSFQFFLSLEDELLRCRSHEELTQLRQQARPDVQGELPERWLAFFSSTQRYLETLHRKQRKFMLRTEQTYLKSLTQMGLDPYLELSDGI